LTFETITCEKTGKAVTIALNRPDTLNVKSDTMSEELATALNEADQDE